MKFKGEQNFQHENEQKKGVLIAYLGTPDSPDVLSVRRYLKSFYLILELLKYQK